MSKTKARSGKYDALIFAKELAAEVRDKWDIPKPNTESYVDPDAESPGLISVGKWIARVLLVATAAASVGLLFL